MRIGKHARQSRGNFVGRLRSANHPKHVTSPKHSAFQSVLPQAPTIACAAILLGAAISLFLLLTSTIIPTKALAATTINITGVPTPVADQSVNVTGVAVTSGYTVKKTGSGWTVADTQAGPYKGAGSTFVQGKHYQVSIRVKPDSGTAALDGSEVFTINGAAASAAPYLSGDGSYVVTAYMGVATAAATNYDVWVGGARVTSANATDVLGDGCVSYTPATGAAAAVLSLSGAAVACTSAGGGATGLSIAAGIYSEDDLILELSGTNSVVEHGATAAGTYADYAAGIYCAGELTIRAAGTAGGGGDGAGGGSGGSGTVPTLTVVAEGHAGGYACVAGIWAAGGLSVSGASVTARGADNAADPGYSYGVLAFDQDMGTSVNVSVGAAGSKLVAIGGNVAGAFCVSSGVSARDVVVAGGTLIAIGGELGGTTGPNSYSAGIAVVTNAPTGVVITGGTVVAAAGGRSGVTGGVKAAPVLGNGTGAAVEVLPTFSGYEPDVYFGASCAAATGSGAVPATAAERATASTYTNSAYVSIVPAGTSPSDTGADSNGGANDGTNGNGDGALDNSNQNNGGADGGDADGGGANSGDSTAGGSDSGSDSGTSTPAKLPDCGASFRF